jgi:hypothetical protein
MRRFQTVPLIALLGFMMACHAYSRCEAACFFSGSERLSMEGHRRKQAAPKDALRLAYSFAMCAGKPWYVILVGPT